MSHRVRLTDSALADIEAAVRFIREESQAPLAAEGSYEGLVEAVLSLAEVPRRCPIIPEARELKEEIRHLLYHSHRILFRVEERSRTVTVLRVYHGARDRIGEADIAE